MSEWDAKMPWDANDSIENTTDYGCQLYTECAKHGSAKINGAKLLLPLWNTWTWDILLGGTTEGNY